MFDKVGLIGDSILPPPEREKKNYTSAIVRITDFVRFKLTGCWWSCDLEPQASRAIKRGSL